MATPRISFDKTTPDEPVKAPTRGFEWFQSPEAPANQVARKPNEHIEAQAGNQNFPISVPDEARRAAEARGGMGAESNDKR